MINITFNSPIIPSGTARVNKQATPEQRRVRNRGHRRPDFSKRRMLTAIAGNSTTPVKIKL